MDLKQKLMNLMHKPELHLLSQNTHHETKTLPLTGITRDSEAEIRDFKTDPLADQEILESIEPIYFQFGADTSNYQLEKLPPDLDLQVINADRQTLLKQLTVVSKKVFSLILQKQPQCLEELENVVEIQDELDSSLGMCRSGRMQLKAAQHTLTTASLDLIANYKKREMLTNVYQYLRTIQTLRKSQLKLQELLKENDFSQALQLLLESQSLALNYSQFDCVKELSVKLQDTLESAEDQLDCALVKVILGFSDEHYSQLQLAYGLLGKRPAALQQLSLHLSSSLHQSALTVVRGYVELCGDADRRSKDALSWDYQDWSKKVSLDCLLGCLEDVCKSIWRLLVAYQHILRWHRSAAAVEARNESENGEESDLLQRLEQGRGRIWQDAQLKIKVLLQGVPLHQLKMDDFLKVLDLGKKLMDIGREFVGSDSEVIQEALRQHSVEYFKHFHAARLEELRVFVEHEGWEICPVRNGFSVLQLQEFAFLKKYVTHGKDATRSTHYFEEFTDSYPFESSSRDETILEESFLNESTFSDHEDDKEDYCHRSRKTNTIFTNTALTLLRLCGRYVRLMGLLEPIAFDVLICLNQLLDYYLYAVHVFFADSQTLEVYPKLSSIIRKIEESLILKSEETAKNKVPAPGIPPGLDVTHPESLYGLPVRLVAAESVVTLAKQMEVLQPVFEQLLPPSKHSALKLFLSQSKSVALELRVPIYAAIAHRVIDWDALVSHVSKVPWDIREVMSQHSSYVDSLIRELQVFSMRLEALSSQVYVPPEISHLLWDQILRRCNRALLEGFSNAKKCTNEGRALMQLDLRQFSVKAESLSKIRPLPDLALVETYIKAYYLPEVALDEWVHKHTEYTPRQLVSLVQCVANSHKKPKLTLANLIEELQELSRR